MVTQRHNEIRDALGDLVAMGFKEVVREPIVKEADFSDSGFLQQDLRSTDSAAARVVYFSFQVSAEERTALHKFTDLVYDWASTRTSSNATVCGCHTPRALRSAINAGESTESSAS